MMQAFLILVGVLAAVLALGVIYVGVIWFRIGRMLLPRNGEDDR